MYLRSIVPLALSTSAVLAFQDTSPFFLLSTTKLPQLPEQQVATSDRVLHDISSTLDTLDSQVYILVSQPGVSVDDFSAVDASVHLSRRIRGKDGKIRSTAFISEVIPGTLSSSALEKELQSRRPMKAILEADIKTGVVNENEDYPHILKVDLPLLPATPSRRAAKLAEHDSFVNAAIDSIGPDTSYTLFYTTTPPSKRLYEQEHAHQQPAKEVYSFEWDNEDSNPDVYHIDLKRDNTAHLRRRDNTTLNEGAPLFEKYNFLSPGIFMGGLAVFVLFLIGSVGLSGLSGIEVSYGAFAKEMGAQSQKKQQ